MNYDDLQIAHKLWLDRNYPDQPAEVPAAGIVEESGEFLHAVLKLTEGQIWGADKRYTQLEHDVEDAVGDCAIYVCSLCNALGYPFVNIATVGPLTVADNVTSIAACVELVRCSADLFTSPRRSSAIALYMAMLKGVAKKLGVDFDVALRGTWERVSQRKRVSPVRDV